MIIDNHIHIGVDPLFYLNGWSPYCLDIPRLLIETEGSGVDAWVVFPFVSYFALDVHAMSKGDVTLSTHGDTVPYRFENGRLLEDIARLDPANRRRFMPLLIADPLRETGAQLKSWEALTQKHEVFGIKIQPTIIQAPILSLLDQGRAMLDFAEERDLPFLIHSSISPKDIWSQCSDILRVAEARPGIRFILAHSCRFHHPSLERIAQLPNTWFDCSAHIIHCQCAVRNLATVAVPEERFPSDYSDPARVLRDLADAYPDKLIWGSDAPFYSYEDSNIQLRSTYRAEIEALNALPEDLRQRVCNKNTQAWLGRSCRA